ncbi:MAG: hypothetical protein CIT03_04650 [Methanobacterium sp.]|nr:MAG: hypothetical protein CIT03_04650 [Methanobacterium sp.]
MEKEVNINPLFYISGLGMVAVAIIAILYILKQNASPFILFLGGLSWIISVAMKFLWASKTNKQVIKYLNDRFSPELSGPLSWSYIGLLTGVFECGFVLVLVLFTPLLYQAAWIDVIAFGIGFGAIESFFLGIIGILTLFNPQKITSDTLERYELNRNNLLTIPLGIVERISTLFVHIFTCALIFIAVQGGNYFFFWVSFLFKSLIDSIAGWLHLEKDIRNVKSAYQHWKYQFIFLVLGIISLAGVLILGGI